MLVYYMSEKCKKAINDNKAYFMAKIADPGSIISFNISSDIYDKAEGGMAGLWAFARDYMKQNSDAIAMAALKATGQENTFQDAFNLAMNMMASAIMGQNNLILKMMQELAWSIMRDIKSKDDKLYEIAEHVKELYMLLASLIATTPEWDAYYKKLRDALALIESTKADLKIVSSTYKSSNRWLSKKFDGTVTKLEQARDLITPKENNPAVSRISEGSYKIQSALKTGQPDKTKSKKDTLAQTHKKSQMITQGARTMEKGLAFFGSGLSDQFPFPTTEQQWQAMIAIGKVSSNLIKSMQGYFELTTTVNLMIAAFLTGLEDIKLGVNNLFKKFVLNLLAENIRRVEDLSDSMATSLNGEAFAKSGPVKDPFYASGYHTPNSVTVTTMSFKWIMDINMIFSSYKMIPTKQLEALDQSQGAVDFYNYVCRTLKAMGDQRSGLAVLKMKEAQEITGDLETQIIALVLETNAASTTGTVNRGILSLCRTVLSRLELSFVTDHNIFVLMQQFYYMPLPDASSLNQSYGALTANFKAFGGDRAMACIASGDFKTLFKMSGKDATYCGAALATVAFLKKCLGIKWPWTLSDVEAELHSDLDLLNIEFSINFDLSILKNLLLCLRLNSLAGVFDPLELLCAIAKDIRAGGTTSNTSDSFKKIKDVFTKTFD